jgi:very-short-patch-repair endonuclease
MTEAERLLWSKLKQKQLNGFQFYRQRIIGRYIVDFYCPTTRLVIEVDGSQHYYPDAAAVDKERDKYLESLGLKVLRFSNLDVMREIEGVVEVIRGNLLKPRE